MKSLLRILGMDRRAFTANVEAGIFPDGLIRPGERLKKWDSEDLRWMDYRMKNQARFSTTAGSAKT